MKRGNHRGRSRPSASSTERPHSSPSPRSSGDSPSLRPASAKVNSVGEFLDKNKALAEHLKQSHFDVKAAEFQASQKVKGLAASASSPSSVRSAAADLVDVCPVRESRPGHSASASRVAHTLGSEPSLCASPVASGSSDWVSVVPPKLGATWGSGGHCTEASASPSGYPQATTRAVVHSAMSTDGRSLDVRASVPPLTAQLRPGYGAPCLGATQTVTGGYRYCGPTLVSDSRRTLPPAWKSFAPPRMVRTYRSLTAPGRVSDLRAHSVVDGSGGFNPSSSRFDVAQPDEATVSALQIQPPRDSSPSRVSDFSSVQFDHPTVLPNATITSRCYGSRPI